MFIRNVASLLTVSASFSLYASAQLAGQTIKFESILSPSQPGNCLIASSNTDGAAVVVGECGTNATALNSWVVPNGANSPGPLQIFGDKCLDVTNGANADGTKLQIWTCATGNTNQLWVPTGSDNIITWSGTTKCIDVTNGDLTDGNQVQIWDCDSTNGNQKFLANAVTSPTAFTIASKLAPSLCIAASANAGNASVVVANCDATSAAQKWSDPKNNGQMIIYDNLCVTLATGPLVSPSNGVKLVLQTCVANAEPQRWGHRTGQIINFNIKGECIDLTGGVTTPGNQLQTWDCSTTDNLNQDWVVTNTF
ncbi:ricin B lectin domain-containing protein [Mycena metata]|uniref:Ricin B lectin domain-containing protein n=1 Tax=Mycena metata TaxID=1033252 RepID=A0AAD7K6V7_9AGAR|nr:ricin B lectin domain-containing protein [Mycena metata]